MSHELIYTSAPRGLQPGSQGFCTVAATVGLPMQLQERLESLSSYRAIFPPLDINAGRNPVALSHVHLTVGGKGWRVLSRINAAGLDYSQRSNSFAHHVALAPEELPGGGPGWLLAQPGFMEIGWDGQVRQLPRGRTPPRGDMPTQPCRAWQEWTGDAGWAGVLAESFEKNPQRPVYLLYRAGMNPLPLLVEALAILPPEKRWQVTFSTYFAGLPQGVTCAWRCVPREAAEAAEVGKNPGVLVIELDRKLGMAAPSAFVEAARTGRGPVRIETPVAAHVPHQPTPALPVSAQPPMPGRYEADEGHDQPSGPGVYETAASDPDRNGQRDRSAVGEYPTAPSKNYFSTGIMIGAVVGFLLTGGLASAMYVAVVKRQVDDAKRERDDFEQKSSSLASEAGSLNRKLKDAEKDKGDSEEKLTSQITKLKAELTDLKGKKPIISEKDLTALQKANKDLEKDKTELTKANEKLKDQVKGMEAFEDLKKHDTQVKDPLPLPLRIKLLMQLDNHPATKNLTSRFMKLDGGADKGVDEWYEFVSKLERESVGIYDRNVKPAENTLNSVLNEGPTAVNKLGSLKTHLSNASGALEKSGDSTGITSLNRQIEKLKIQHTILEQAEKKQKSVEKVLETKKPSKKDVENAMPVFKGLDGVIEDMKKEGWKDKKVYDYMVELQDKLKDWEKSAK